MSLPAPKNDYEIVALDTEPEEGLDANQGDIIEDQADIDLKREKEAEEKRKYL